MLTPREYTALIGLCAELENFYDPDLLPERFLAKIARRLVSDGLVDHTDRESVRAALGALNNRLREASGE